ncbi:MAG: hypothetical protein ABWY00_04070 [Dongiaceae bacterium]
MAIKLTLFSCMLLATILAGCAEMPSQPVAETSHPAIGISGWPDAAELTVSSTQLAAANASTAAAPPGAGLGSLAANGGVLTMNGTVPPIQPTPPGSISMSTFNVSLNVTLNR